MPQQKPKNERTHKARTFVVSLDFVCRHATSFVGLARKIAYEGPPHMGAVVVPPKNKM